MTPFVIVLVAGPFIFWLFRRWQARHSAGEPQQEPQSADGVMPVEAVAVALRNENKTAPPENPEEATAVELPPGANEEKTDPTESVPSEQVSLPLAGAVQSAATPPQVEPVPALFSSPEEDVHKTDSDVQVSVADGEGNEDLQNSLPDESVTEAHTIGLALPAADVQPGTTLDIYGKELVQSADEAEESLEERQSADGLITLEAAAVAALRNEYKTAPPKNSEEATAVELPAGWSQVSEEETDPTESLPSKQASLPLAAGAQLAATPPQEAVVPALSSSPEENVHIPDSDALVSVANGVGNEDPQKTSSAESVIEEHVIGLVLPAVDVDSGTTLDIYGNELVQCAAQTKTNGGSVEAPAAALEAAAYEEGSDKAAPPILETEAGATVPHCEVVPVAVPPNGADETELDKLEPAVAPGRYRPPAQRHQFPSMTRSAKSEHAVRAILEIRVRLKRDRFWFCQIGLLPERIEGMDDEVIVKAGGQRLGLVSQEDWYSDVYSKNIGEYLQHGVRLTGVLANRQRVRWQLKGRDLYVLAGYPKAFGFVSVPRLLLGRSHVVLCIGSLLEQVEALLKEAGCDNYVKLDHSHGMPPGWIGLRDVLPSAAIPLDPGIDPFYPIKPAPDIDIALEGGIRLHDSTWLAGYPPKIRLLGETTNSVKLMIDGKEAQPADDGFFREGFDVPGEHIVQCDGLSCSRSYSIEEPEESWHQWPAYRFLAADICGPLVQLRPEAKQSRVFTVPMSNPLLLGAEPGQVFRCSTRSVANWTGFVPFDVVWALPAHPLICDKKTSRILQFSSAPVALTQRNARAPLEWYSAILDASRKGLRIENASQDSVAQWTEYRKAARNIWRAKR